MIEQIKRYRVTCDGLLISESGMVRQCNVTCEIEATEKPEVLRHLPTGWETVYRLSYNETFCPAEHYLKHSAKAL